MWIRHGRYVCLFQPRWRTRCGGHLRERRLRFQDRGVATSLGRCQGEQKRKGWGMNGGKLSPLSRCWSGGFMGCYRVKCLKIPRRPKSSSHTWWGSVFGFKAFSGDVWGFNHRSSPGVWMSRFFFGDETPCIVYAFAHSPGSVGNGCISKITFL